MTGKRILVIGGAGFIGSNLVRYLAKKGNDLVVYDQKTLNIENEKELLIQTIIGDLSDKKNINDSLERAMDGCDVVYNSATVMSPLKRHKQMREIVNTDAARTVAKIVRKKGGIRLIHVSSSSAIGIPTRNEIIDENCRFNFHDNHYALTKYLGDEAVLDEVRKGLDAVVANLCSTFGSYGMVEHQRNLFGKIAGRKLFTYPPGGLCLVDIDTVVSGLVSCCEKGIAGRRYILGGHNVTYKHYFDQVAQETGGRPPKFRISKSILPLAGYVVETIYDLMKKETKITKSVAKLLCINSFYSSGLAQKELNYTISDWKEAIKKVCQQYLLKRNVGENISHVL